MTNLAGRLVTLQILDDIDPMLSGIPPSISMGDGCLMTGPAETGFSGNPPL